MHGYEYSRARIAYLTRGGENGDSSLGVQSPGNTGIPIYRKRKHTNKHSEISYQVFTVILLYVREDITQGRKYFLASSHSESLPTE
jgi:hypothetical protein